MRIAQRVFLRLPICLHRSHVGVQLASRLLRSHVTLVRLCRGKKRTCIAHIVSISTTKRSDVDHTELSANTPHLPVTGVSLGRYIASQLGETPRVRDNDNGKSYKYVFMTTNQPESKSNPNRSTHPNPKFCRPVVCRPVSMSSM